MNKRRKVDTSSYHAKEVKSKLVKVSTPFDRIENFERGIAGIIDEYADNVLSHKFTHWTFALGLSFSADDALLAACRHNDIDAVKILSTQVLPSEPLETRMSAFVDACIESDSLDCLKELVKFGHRLTQEDLWWSTTNGTVDVVKYIVEQGVSVNHPGADMHPLVAAALHKNDSMCMFLFPHSDCSSQFQAIEVYPYLIRLVKQT